MRVAFIAAECEPWAKTGGLADVVDALARALGRISGGPEAPIDVFLPRYRGMILPEGDHRSLTIRIADPMVADGASDVRVLSVQASGYRVRLIDHPRAFDRAGYYGDPGAGDYPDNAWRFALLCRAALETLRVEAVPVDVLHLHDWHAAPAILIRDAFHADDPILGGTAALLTIHNLAYHGWTPASRLDELGIPGAESLVAKGVDGLDLLRVGIAGCELVNTVSPGYAAEALTPEYGMGLDDALLAKVDLRAPDGGRRFLGILNGLDNALWDPATDSDLAAVYRATDLRGKTICRADLLRRHGLDPDDPGPVLGMIGRLDPQKGFDLLAKAAPTLIELGARIIVQGSGDPRLADAFRTLAGARPDLVALVERFDRANARRIYAGSDFFVMPSRFEPCGQGQMIALRYGTPPIVRRTGGLRDTVIDETTSPGRGTGFVFDQATPGELARACERAFEFRGPQGSGSAEFRALIERGMATDFDWETGSAPRYMTAYRQAVAVRSRERMAIG